jgi:hypothetical protein
VASYVVNDIWLYLRWLRLGHRDPGEVARKFAFVIYTHLGLRHSFERQEELQTLQDNAFDLPVRESNFRDAAKSKLEQLDATSPPIPASKEYVF